MSNFYEEVLLREEYNLVAKLQKNKEFSKYVDVKYEDRITGEHKSVLLPPSANKYPEIYIVDYQMPVFINDGQLRNDWHGTASMRLSEPVLSNRHANHGPHTEFDSNFEPFNNHVQKNSICSGNAWIVAKDNGLWHYIISLGALINQDEFVCAEGSHFNKKAFDYWISRRRRPVTNIKWPLDLLSKGSIVVEAKSEVTTNDKKKISIVKNVSGITQTSDKKKIRIVSRDNLPKKKISIIKKNSSDE